MSLPINSRSPTGTVLRLIRIEGLAVLVGVSAVYFFAGMPWWLYALLFFAPDFSFAGYVFGPGMGAIIYNLLHSLIGPVGLGLLGLFSGGEWLQAIALIWFAHIGFDRAFGYGLKYADSFSQTHLGPIGRGRQS